MTRSHVITKIHLSLAAMIRRMFCKFCPQVPLDICKKYLPIFLNDLFCKMESVIRFFLVWMQSSVLYCKKAYIYLNIKENFLDIYFQIALMVGQRSLQMEFATMSLSLSQSKCVFLQLACDLVVNGCGLPYELIMNCAPSKHASE